jgi:seryl-tRNA synthetase
VIDVRLLRHAPDTIREALARRSKSELIDQVDAAIRLDGRLRDIGLERDDLRRRVNEISKEVGALRRGGDTAAAEALMASSRELGARESELAGEFDEVDAQLRELLLRIPNLPHPDAPDGTGDHDNPVVTGPNNMPTTFADHQRVPHWEIVSGRPWPVPCVSTPST